MTANTYSHNQAFVESRRVHLRECDTGTVRRYVRGQSLSDWHPQQETNAFLFTNSFMPPTSQRVGQGHTPLALLIRENLQTHMRAITQHHPHSSAVTFGSARELSSELGATLPELYFKSTLMWRIVGRFFSFFFFHISEGRLMLTCTRLSWSGKSWLMIIYFLCVKLITVGNKLKPVKG